MKEIEYLDKKCFEFFCKDLNISSELKEEISQILGNIDVSHLLSEDVYCYIDFKKFSNKIKSLNMEPSSLSVVYIVRNEASYIRRSIENVLKIADEIIIFDTGSVDSTVDIIKSINSNKIKLINSKWSDNFSVARNEANKYATSDWILTMDADEMIDFEVGTIRKLLSFLNNFSSLENTVFTLKLSGENGSFRAGRLIKNKGFFYYKGKVHEIYANRNLNLSYPRINLKLEIKYENRQSDKKREYYNRLLLDTMSEYPEEQRWGFLYLRDNIKCIDIKEFEFIANRYLLINPNNTINTSNLKIDDYTHGLFIIILRKYLREGELNKFSIYLCLAKEFFNSLDLIYLEYLYYEIKIKQQQKELLDKFLIQYDKISANGEFFDEHYIDSLLGVFLLNNGYISEAKKIFEDISVTHPNLPCFKNSYIKEVLLYNKPTIV